MSENKKKTARRTKHTKYQNERFKGHFSGEKDIRALTILQQTQMIKIQRIIKMHTLRSSSESHHAQEQSYCLTNLFHFTEYTDTEMFGFNSEPLFVFKV